MQNKTIGFTFYRDGKKNRIEKVDSNHVLLNGNLVKMNYNTAKTNAKKMDGYKPYTEKDKERRRREKEKIGFSAQDEISANRSIRRKERIY